MSIEPLDPQVTGAHGGGYRASETRGHHCRACGGHWLDRRTLDELLVRASSTPSQIGAVVRQTMSMTEAIVYRDCPCCGQQMNRRNFAHYSGVVVDECRRCGTYFDMGELRDVFAFVRSGGLMFGQLRATSVATRDQAAALRLLLQSRTPVQPRWSEIDLIVWAWRWLGRGLAACSLAWAKLREPITASRR